MIWQYLVLTKPVALSLTSLPHVWRVSRTGQV